MEKKDDILLKIDLIWSVSTTTTWIESLLG